MHRDGYQTALRYRSINQLQLDHEDSVYVQPYFILGILLLFVNLAPTKIIAAAILTVDRVPNVRYSQLVVFVSGNTRS